MESSLYSCIQAIQDGDKEQALAFLEKFSPLLKKYAYFLQTEDALQELQCFLLAFVKNLHLNKLTSSTDGAIISYINKTIYHHYIALPKGNRNKIPTVSIEDKSDFDPLQFDSNFGESDTYSNLLLMDLQRALTADECVLLNELIQRLLHWIALVSLSQERESVIVKNFIFYFFRCIFPLNCRAFILCKKLLVE